MKKRSRVKAGAGNKNNFFTSSKTLLMALLVFAAAAVTYTIASGAVVSHRPSEIQPQGAGSGLDSGKLEGLSSADIIAAAGGGAGAGGSAHMPLDGVLTYSIIGAGYPPAMNTVPLAMPKNGCSVIVTACSSASSATTAISLNANPIAATLRSANQIVASDLPGMEGNGDDAYYVCNPGYNLKFVPYYYLTYCIKANCPAANPYLEENGYPGYWWGAGGNPSYCFADPRCSNAAANEVLAGYQHDSGQCAYCPTSKPLYDARTHACLSTNDVTTTDVGGNCQNFKVTLDTTLTTVSFKSGGSVGSPYLVYVAYSCPP